MSATRLVCNSNASNISMDVDSDYTSTVSNVDDWLSCFSTPTVSKPGAFPFTSHKIQSIEYRRARMSDLLILDVLLIRGGIHNPDMLFPPPDWTALRKLLNTIDESIYDILKKDCLVYILLKWAWDKDPRETNPGWDARYIQDRSIPPQFASLAHAYWLLDTGTHLTKAISILSDSRLNRDYVSKILQALALSSSPASFASGAAPATAALVVKYVRTAKPLLTEPDDIDLYALSLAQLSFMDAWGYQKSFPEGSDTRERLLRKIVGWCLMPTPKQEPLSQLLAFPLSSYEHSSLHALALPSPFPSLRSLADVNAHTMATPHGPALSSQAVSILQDLLCVRAIQSGDYVGAIKLDRQFSFVSPSLGSAAPASSVTSQTAPSGRDVIDRKSIIQDLFATLPPAERTLLEDEIGKVAAGVRADASSTPRQGASAARKRLVAEMSLSASWEDVGAGTGSPVRSTSHSSSAIGAGFANKATPMPGSTNGKVSQQPFLASTSTSPFTSRVSRPQPISGHQGPPTPKFTAFGSPIPPATGTSMGRGVIADRGRTLFSTGTAGGQSVAAKPTARVSLFETAGSAKNAPNAFYKPPSAPPARATLDVASALPSSSAAKSAVPMKQNGKTHGDEGDGEDVSMESRSDAEIVEDTYRNEPGGEERDEAAATKDEDAENFITYDKGDAADLTLHKRDADEMMDDDDGAGVDLGFSVFSRGRDAAQNGGVGKRSVSGNGHAPRTSPPSRPRVSPPREDEKNLSASVNSATTSRWRAPPGAFDHEEEDDEEQHDQPKNEDKGEEESEEDDRALTTPISSPHRSMHTRTQAETPTRPSMRSQPRRSSKDAMARRPSMHAGRTPSKPPKPSRTIPGALTDDEHEHLDMHCDDDTEMDEQEEDDAIAPLPSRASRRTRSSGFIGVPTTVAAPSKSKPGGKLTGQTRGGSEAGTTGKGKNKARPSEARTPARRSSRLSTASSLSPEHTEVASPTKKGRKSTGPRVSTTGSGTGTIATRSSSRRKR